MEMRGLLQTEIILNIWNILIMVSGDIVINVENLPIKSVHLRDAKILFDTIITSYIPVSRTEINKTNS